MSAHTVKEDGVFKERPFLSFSRHQAMPGDQQVITGQVAKDLNTNKPWREYQGMKTVSPDIVQSFREFQWLPVLSHKSAIGTDLAGCSTRFPATNEINVRFLLPNNGYARVAENAGLPHGFERRRRQSQAAQGEHLAPVQ